MGLTTRAYSPEPEDFKDGNGRWRTRSLFLETNDDEGKFPSVFTLGLSDKEGRVSMRAIYLEANDPTEYRAAKLIFGSFDCWEKLTKSPFFVPHLEKWRVELQRHIKSEAVHVITNVSYGATTGNAQLSAAKWLASQSWVGPELKAPSRGRPTKEHDPAEALKIGLQNAEEDEKDFKRIFGEE